MTTPNTARARVRAAGRTFTKIDPARAPWSPVVFASVAVAQGVAHVVSTVIMVLLVLTSFVQDISTIIERKLPAFYRMFPQPPDRPAPSPRLNRPHIVLPASDPLPPPTKSAPPPPSFLKRIAGRLASGASINAEDEEDLDLDPRCPKIPNPTVRWYIEAAGYECETRVATTRDGFVLQLDRIVVPSAPNGAAPQAKNSKTPVVLLHGLFQSAGVFVTCGSQSLAFHLADRGYDVWLANNRMCNDAHIRKHAFFKKSDVRLWDWSLEDLARYDVPAIIDAVNRWCGSDRVAFVGHSQGNAQMFLALQLDPSLNDKLAAFVALAPAVYTGPLLNVFPVNLLIGLDDWNHRFIFGTGQMLPIMHVVEAIVPASVMTTLSYHMFHFLFDWSDRNWQAHTKVHTFQFTPRPESSKNIHHWARIGRRGKVCTFSDTSTESRFDVSCVKCPLAMWYGTRDTIVDAPRLIRECREDVRVQLVAAEEIVGYEHMDCLWASDARELVAQRVADVFDGLEL
ncbi:hypothetical protein HDU83_008918 [Entophlyctis luteolus]|nr:hypothetical protein HDU83_008918 [Entophlyctis luteolus]